MAKDLPSKPPTSAPLAPDLNDPRMKDFLSGAQVQMPQSVATAPSPQAVPQATPAAPPRHERVIKDGFSMPVADYDLIEACIQRALDSRLVMSKSGILRAAIRALSDLDDASFRRVVGDVREIKAGRKKIRPL
jgi:hypothetical protein